MNLNKFKIIFKINNHKKLIFQTIQILVLTKKKKILISSFKILIILVISVKKLSKKVKYKINRMNIVLILFRFLIN